MRILLVEDEPDLGAAIKRTLNQEKYVVDWVLDGTEAWEYLNNQSTTYTLAIFDWALPGLSGLELCKRLRARRHSLPVLMLTARDRMEDKVAGLDAGADDYLIKPFGMAELLARLRALQRRSPSFQPQQLQVGSLTLDYGNRTVYRLTPNRDKQAIPLTNKEFQLLEYLMRHPRQILTRDQIEQALWEWGTEPESNAITALVRRLRQRLQVVGAADWIETVYGRGYSINPPE